MVFRVKPMVAAIASVLALGVGSSYAADSMNKTAAGDAARTGDSRQGAGSPAQRQDAYASQPSRNTTADTKPAQRSAQRQTMADARATRIIGMNVLTTTGNDLGEINDLAIDLANNKIHYAIIGHGGVLGLGEKEIAVPVSQFRLHQYRNTLVTGLTEQQLENAPGLDRVKSDWNDPRLWTNVGQYYHRTLGMPGGQANAMRFSRASDVIGMEVEDPSGDNIGEIEDLVVNLANGTIHYAVLEFDRAWNPNNKLVALPLSSFKQQSDRDDLSINMTREQIARAPAFDRRSWPDMADSTFRNTVLGYGGMRDRTVGMEQNRSPAAAAHQGPQAAVTTVLLVEEPEFMRLDTNRDDRLSRAEAQQVGRLTEHWSRADLDNDGYLTRQEIRQFSTNANNRAPAASGSTNPNRAGQNTGAPNQNPTGAAQPSR